MNRSSPSRSSIFRACAVALAVGVVAYLVHGAQQRADEGQAAPPAAREATSSGSAASDPAAQRLSDLALLFSSKSGQVPPGVEIPEDLVEDLHLLSSTKVLLVPEEAVELGTPGAAAEPAAGAGEARESSGGR